jgi:RNA polymerase sigma factor (sigma-70 family)
MPTRADRLLHCVRRIAAQAGPEPNDAALLASFVTGRDQSAFEALVARHGPMVLRVCRHVLGNRHDAEDAFQATFLVLARKAGSVRLAGCLSAWLHGVACRVALGARAPARRRRREPLAPELAPPDPRPDPLAELTAREALSILEEEVQRLPEAYRLPVVLCCLHGLTQEDAARQLGWTPGSVKGRLERGRKHLQRRLAGRGLGLAAALALVEVSRATAAGLGDRLVASTAMAATGAAFGSAAGAGLVSAEISALAEGALTRGTLTKLKVGLLWLLVVGAVATGLVAWGHQKPAGNLTAMAEGAEPKRPAPDAEPPRSPNVTEQARADRSGDPLPPGGLARLGSARLNQGAAVAGLAFSPDGKVVASCGESSGEDHAIHLWDVATGKEVMSLRPDEHVYTLSFSPDGRLLASAGPETAVRLWDVAGGKERCRCGDESRWVTDLAFSPNGKLLAGNHGRCVTLWDTTTGKMVRTWEGNEWNLWSVAFSPDGATLAAAGQGNALHLWDVADGSERRRIAVDKPNRPVRPLAFSPDGKLVALATDDRSIRLWDPATGRELPPLRGHTAHIRRLAFVDDGKTLVSASEDCTIRFWDTATAKQVRAVAIPTEGWECWVMAFSPDRKTLAAGGSSNRVHLFDVATGKPRQARDGHAGPVEAVGFLPRGDLVASVGGWRVVCLAETATGKERHRSASRPGYRLSMVLSQQYGDRLLISPAALSRDGSLVAVPDEVKKGEETTVRIWDVASDREVGSFAGDLGSVIRLAFSPDNKALALACYDKTIRVWDTAARKEVRRLTGH